MPDQHDKRMTPANRSLGQALRDLPVAQPPDMWPQLARRARRGRGRHLRRAAIPLALAATVLLVVLVWPRPTTHEPVPSAAVAPTSQQTPEHDTTLPALRQRSQRLEDWVRVLNAQGAPLDGPSLAQATRLEGRISMVDLQLAASDDKPPVQQVLWQQRIELLQQLAAVRLGQARLASISTDTGNLTFN